MNSAYDKFFESKTINKKQTFKLNEKCLKRIIRESIDNVLNEGKDRKIASICKWYKTSNKLLDKFFKDIYSNKHFKAQSPEKYEAYSNMYQKIRYKIKKSINGMFELFLIFTGNRDLVDNLITKNLDGENAGIDDSGISQRNYSDDFWTEKPLNAINTFFNGMCDYGDFCVTKEEIFDVLRKKRFTEKKFFELFEKNLFGKIFVEKDFIVFFKNYLTRICEYICGLLEDVYEDFLEVNNLTKLSYSDESQGSPIYYGKDSISPLNYMRVKRK